ncbi:MAG: hypothetical protein ABFD07_16030 [Methanobacterium sp.]
MVSSNLKTDVSCSNPECSHRITITVDQKRELLTENFLKYGKISLIYCSKACQEEHQAKLAESKFLHKGALKNHEYALIIDGADVTKRPKEKEVHIITGPKMEQRAYCLREELMSVTPIKKRKIMYPIDIQAFIRKKLTGKLRVSEARVQVTASELIDICAQLYPSEISVEHIDGKTRAIVYIK